jgi:TATA-box binding protein (TBP) (component of TFIID and TFIIIB)
MEIVNVVATVTLDRPLDLAAVQEVLPGSKMGGSRPPCVQYRLLPENYYVPFYASGTFLVNGLRSANSVLPVADRVISILVEGGLEIKATSIAVHNIVARDSMEREIRVEHVFEALRSKGEHVEYRPETFSGLIVKRDGASFQLFPSGTIVCAGLKKIGQVQPAVEAFRALIAGLG